MTFLLFNWDSIYSICTDPAIQYPQANIIFLDLYKINKGSWSGSESSASERSLSFLAQDCESDIDTRLLKIVKKVASGSCGDMWVTVTLLSLVADLSYLVVFSSYDACVLVWRFLGTYSGEEVAVKVLNPENLNQNAWSEFKQEIYMLRYSSFPWIICVSTFFL